MVSSSDGIGGRVKAAREQAGLTQEELAGLVGVDRSLLGKIEIGARKVSALELARIADELDVRLEWFVSDAPPAIVSRRNMLEPGAPSLTIDRVTERVAREVSFVIGHDSNHWLPPQPVSMRRPRNRSEVELAALNARRMLGLQPDEPALNLSSLVAGVGLLSFSFDLGAETADGSSMLLDGCGIAVINGHLHVGRRRLTLAHELGHYLFADQFSVDWHVSEAAGDSREARIDHFARALLIPAEDLRRLWVTQLETRSLREAAVIIGSHFRVDMATLARRLGDLNLGARAQVEQVRAVRTTRADIVDFDLIVAHEMNPPELPRSYVEAVLRLYRRQAVSAARSMDLLFDTWNEDDLPDLPMLPEQAIWSFVS